MSTVLVGSEVLAQLRAADGEVEFRDAGGDRVVLTKPTERHVEVTDEEIRAIDWSGPYFTPEQGLERLRGLTK